MKGFFNKRIPTLFGILLIVLGIPLTIFILKDQTGFKSRAENSQEPKDIKITNITDKSLTITYRTDQPSTSSLSYGDDKKLGESELENIDKEKGSFSPKNIHSISVEKLNPNTKYYLTIISGSNTFLDNGNPFEVTTGPKISSPSARNEIIKGKIILPDGSPTSETIVYLDTENSQLLSNITKEDGKFSFSLKELRTGDLTSYLEIEKNTVFKIYATNGSLKSTTLVSLSQADSIPTITLSNDYNFTQESSPTSSKSAQYSGFPSITVSKKDLKPQILTPKENKSFNSQKPQFSGTCLPNEKVEIVINSDEEITSQVTSDSNGNWTYRPSTNLSPGMHTITIKTKDSSGILRTITQAFTVYAAEVPTPTPTNIPISTPTSIPTPTIFPIQQPISSTPIISPSIYPSPTIVSMETKGGLSPTGNPPNLLTAGGIAALLIGLALFLFTRKISL